MIKYAKVINKTNACEVGTGTNEAFYKSIGMELMDVEQAWDGSWHVAGYCPAKPEDEVKQERIAELEKYLADTDWYAVRYAETGVEIPEEVKTKRQEAREEISQLRGDE